DQAQHAGPLQHGGQLGIARTHGVGDDPQPKPRLELGQHLDRVRQRDDCHLPEMLARLLRDQRVAEVEEDRLEGFSRHAGLAASSRARSCPQAASMSRPRVARTVVEIPASCRVVAKARIRARVGGAIELPSIGFLGIRLTWLRGCRTTRASWRAWARLSLTPSSRTYS